MKYSARHLTVAGLLGGLTFFGGHVFAANPSDDTVVARYTFDGIESEGSEAKRLHDMGSEPFNGEDLHKFDAVSPDTAVATRLMLLPVESPRRSSVWITIFCSARHSLTRLL